MKNMVMFHIYPYKAISTAIITSLMAPIWLAGSVGGGTSKKKSNSYFDVNSFRGFRGFDPSPYIINGYRL
jgi:hypothetical protein